MSMVTCIACQHWSLRDAPAMARHGFRNYPMEWWHYTFQPEPDAQTAYDVPVE